jgi:hypothetical protein
VAGGGGKNKDIAGKNSELAFFQVLHRKDLHVVNEEFQFPSAFRTCSTVKLDDLLSRLQVDALIEKMAAIFTDSQLRHNPIPRLVDAVNFQIKFLNSLEN